MGKLTIKEVENAKPGPKQRKLSDGHGMYLLVTKAGKYWRYDYRFLNKRKTMALGVYPDTALKEARYRHQKARELLNDGIDPGLHKKAAKTAMLEASENSFGVLANEWAVRQNWTKDHRRTVQGRLERDILPYLKDRPVTEITAREVLTICRRIESRGAIETAHRCKTIISQVMRYCVVKEIIESDPCRDLKGALTPTKPKHMAAITDPKEIGGLLRAIDTYMGDEITRAALKLAALTFVRPGELRQAEWVEIDFDRKLWIIPPEKMKGRIKHLVPLSNQAFDVISDLKPKTGEGRYLFPSARTTARPMSNNTVLAALRRMGFTKEEMVGHGFRAMASTNLYEMGWQSEVVEMQLGHKDPNAVRAAYNHAKYLPERIKLMQAWADYLDGLKVGGEVIPFKRKA